MTDIAEQLQAALADRYRLDSLLGQGGMATVWLARDLRHDRDVALKVLRPELSAVLGADRFLSEIRIAARLDHPHILTLIDSGASDGILWYVLPYVRGNTLRHRLEREKQLGVEESVDIARQVAGALDYAHRQGVVHRDVKPENILFHEGEVVLADFGIALALREAGGNRLTETGLSLGTPQYMSPEQATGDRALDARSDIYSLGAVLYEMLTGEPPHSGATVQAVIAKLMTERPTAIRTVRETVSPELETTVNRALAKVPADRWPSAADFSRALDAAQSRAPAPSHRGAEPPSRRYLIAGAVLLAVGAAAAFALTSRRAVEPPSRRGLIDPPRVRLTSSGDIRVPAISPDGRHVAFARDRCSPECSQQVVVRELEGQAELAVLNGMAMVYYLSWSPDGRRVMVLGTETGGRFGGFVVSPLGGTPQYLGVVYATFLGSADTVATLNPAAAQGRGAVEVMTLADRVTRDSIIPPEWSSRLLGFLPSPDGKRLLLMLTREPAGAERVIVLTDRTGRLLDSITPKALAVGGPNPPPWLPGNTGLLFPVPDTASPGSWLLGAMRIDPERDRIVTRTRPDPIMRLGATTSPGISLTADGRTLAYNAGSVVTRLHQWTGAGAAPPLDWRQRLERTESVVLDYAPSGRWIALSVGGIGQSSVIELMPFDSGAPRPATPRIADLLGVEWSPGAGGEELYYVAREDRGVRVYSVDPASLRRTERGELPDVEYLSDFEPLADGRLVWLTEPGSVMIREKNGEVRPLDLPGWEPNGTHASPSGTRLLVSAWKKPTFDSVGLLLVDPDAGTTRVLWSDIVENTQFAWLDDGSIRLAVSWSSTRSELFAIYPDGRPMKSLGDLPFAEAVYRFAPDGTRGIAGERTSRDDLWLVRNFSID